MKRQILAALFVVSCSYGTETAIAGPCDAFRTDIGTLQQQVRTNEMSRASTGFDAVAQASQVVKSSCLDPLSSLDMTAFGLTPGAAALVTKLGSQACQKLAQELSQRVNQVQSQISQGINGITSGIPNVVDPSGAINNLNQQLSGQTVSPSTNISPTQSSGLTSQVGNYISTAWDKMTNFLSP